MFLLDDRPELVEQHGDRLPHCSPADDEEGIGKDLGIQQVFHMGDRLAGKQGNGKEGEPDKQGEPAMAEPLAELPVLHQHPVFEMVVDCLGDLLCPFGSGDIGREVNDDPEAGLFREILYRLDNVVFCCRVQFFLVERRRIERVEELHDRIEPDLDQDPAVHFFVQGFDIGHALSCMCYFSREQDKNLFFAGTGSVRCGRGRGRTGSLRSGYLRRNGEVSSLSGDFSPAKESSSG